ncbi:MAG: outer membrane beta-barrel protein [Bryobacteraceae bacterium]|jgi:hypothetical protein
MTLHRFLKTAALVWMLPAACLFAQDDADVPTIRRPSIGVRFQYTLTRLFETSSATASTTQPIADYNYSGSSSSRGVVLTPNLEYRLTNKLSVGLEFQFHHAQYTQVTQIRTGKPDPNSPIDNRKVTTVTQTTTASYWELPLLAHYYGLRRHGLLSRVYLSAGPVYRRVANIRTGNTYQNADGTTNYNEIPATPDRTNQFGAVAGVGFRLVDDFRIKVMPEVRFTRWLNTTFHGPAYRSEVNQGTVGIGLSF